MHKKHWESFFEVARRSMAIDNHSDLNIWLRESLNLFVSHDAMVYSWAEFKAPIKDYDALLFKSDITVSRVKKSEDLYVALKALNKKWLSNKSRWFMLNDSDALFSQIASACCAEVQASKCKSLLAYGVSDEYAGGTSLYVFLSKNPEIEVDHYVVGMLMPYLDAAIKRIKEARVPVFEVDNDALTHRELEIMEWVNKGKTNAEIGLILSISHNTVKNHLKVVFKKLNVISRAQAASTFSIHSRLQ